MTVYVQWRLQYPTENIYIRAIFKRMTINYKRRTNALETLFSRHLRLHVISFSAWRIKYNGCRHHVRQDPYVYVCMCVCARACEKLVIIGSNIKLQRFITQIKYSEPQTKHIISPRSGKDVYPVVFKMPCVTSFNNLSNCLVY